MSKMFDQKATTELFKRVYNNKMITETDTTGAVVRSDEADLKALCQRAFGDGIEYRDPSLVNQFNNLIVRQANEVANTLMTDIIPLLASYRNVQAGNLELIEVPKKIKAKFMWSASNSGVDLIRVAGMDKIPAVPQTYKTGFSYNPNDLLQDTVDKFNALVNDIAMAKVRMYISKIYDVTTAAVTAGTIPAANVVDTSGVTVTQFSKLSATLTRVGNGRPVFIADPLMIDKFALAFANDATYTKFLSDMTKDMLMYDLNYTRIQRTDAFNIVNPFKDDTNTSTELPVSKGFMLNSAIASKPFNIVEYGQMKQVTAQDFETDEIQFKVSFDASVVLIHGNAIGYIKDDSIVL